MIANPDPLSIRICNPHNNVFLNSVGLDCKSSPKRETRGYRTSATTGFLKKTGADRTDTVPGSTTRPGPLSHRSTLGTCSSVPRHFFDIRRINAKQLQNTCQGTIGGMAARQQASWRLPPGCAGVAVLLPQVPYRFSSLLMRIENPYTQWVWIANPDQRHAAEHPQGRADQRHSMEHPQGRERRRRNRPAGACHPAVRAWLFYCLRCHIGSIHCFCGLKILILNGSGLQIQTNGTQPNIRKVGKARPSGLAFLFSYCRAASTSHRKIAMCMG